MARAKAVMFDIDGTLIRTGGAGVKAFNLAGQTAFGIRDGTLHMKFAGRTDTGLVREFFKHHQLKPTTENFQHFLDTYIFWLDHMLPQSSGSICPGVIKLIRDLRRTKNPPLIGLLTGNIRLGAEIKLRQYNLWEEFELGAFADDSEDRSHQRHDGSNHSNRCRLRFHESKSNEYRPAKDSTERSVNKFFDVSRWNQRFTANFEHDSRERSSNNSASSRGEER